MFSGRVLSLPGLPGAAQGASTGPLIAIPSPNADGAKRLYNWATVARHELTHAFNLTQTGFLVPPGKVPTLRSVWQRPTGAQAAERSPLLIAAGLIGLLGVIVALLAYGGASL